MAVARTTASGGRSHSSPLLARQRLSAVKGGHRLADDGDVMVLVRKRKELAGRIVGGSMRCVRVAGSPLRSSAWRRDLLSGWRFAAQPRDDLNLAGLCLAADRLSQD